jgi:capsular polysaccharide biosynthesis protein
VTVESKVAKVFALTPSWGRSGLLDRHRILVGGNTNPVERALQTLLRRIGTVILVTILITGSALAFSFAQTPTYQSTVQMLVGQKSTGAAGSSLSGDVSGLQDLTLTVAKAADTPPIAQAVVEQPNLQGQSAAQLLQNMTATQDTGTTFVTITYTNSNPKQAQLTANAIGKALSEKISEVSLGANGITATVWSQATLPQEPVSPDPLLNAIIALVIGSILGVALAFLLEYIDDRWDSPEQVEEVSGVPTFGVIPRFVDLGSRKGGILAIKKGS